MRFFSLQRKFLASENHIHQLFYFLLKEGEKYVIELTALECQTHNIDILAMECHVDHVYMFVRVYPQQSIPDVVKQIKGATSHKLREEFPQLANMPSLWTRSYFVSTAGNVSSETIKWYVNTQKTRS